MSEGRVSPHKLALDEERAANQMIRLARFGQGRLYDVEWSPDGKYLAIATGLGVYLYDANTFEQVSFLDVNDDSTLIAFNPEGTFLAVARHYFIEVWDVKSARKINQLNGEIKGGIWALTFGTNGYIAAVGQEEKGLSDVTPQIKVWLVSTGQLLYSKEKGSVYTVALDISADGQTILLDYKGMAIHNIQTVEKIQELNGDIDAIFSPDGKKIFTIESIYEGFEEKFRIWMTPISSRNAALILKDSVCNRLSRNGNFTICFGENSVILFDSKNGEAIKTIDFSTPPAIDDAEISSDGRYLAVERGDLVTIFDIQTEQEIKNLYFDSFKSFAAGLIRLDQVERYVAAVSVQNGIIRILDLSNGNVLREFRASDKVITGLAFSPDKITLASVDEKGILQLWNLQNGFSTHKFDLGSKHIMGPIVFSLDGLKISMTNRSQEYTLEFDMQLGEIKKIAENPSGIIYASLLYGWYLPTADDHWVSWE
jgi:WD40 repeat protein